MNALMNWRLSLSTFLLSVLLSFEDDNMHMYKWKDTALIVSIYFYFKLLSNLQSASLMKC